MSTRIARVVAGSRQVGDILNGHRITGFGQVWTLDNEDNCSVGAAPWESVRVCYAYGEPVTAETAAPATEEKAAAPKFGSLEWKLTRLGKLPELIETAERNALLQSRRSDYNSRIAVERNQKAAATMRAELEQLQTEVAALTATA